MPCGEAGKVGEGGGARTPSLLSDGRRPRNALRLHSTLVLISNFARFERRQPPGVGGCPFGRSARLLSIPLYLLCRLSHSLSLPSATNCHRWTSFQRSTFIACRILNAVVPNSFERVIELAVTRFFLLPAAFSLLHRIPFSAGYLRNRFYFRATPDYHLVFLYFFFFFFFVAQRT